MQDDLPDDTLLSDVLLTGRVDNILGRANIKTVGDLRKKTDHELLRLDNCGKMALLEMRLLTGQYRAGQKTKSDQVLKAEWVREVAYGGCTCSFDDWRKEKNNAAGQ